MNLLQRARESAIVAVMGFAVAACSGHDGESVGENGARATTVAASALNVGAGIYDITGPAAERGMMGYAMIDQQTAGIHLRLRSRAFVFESPATGKRAVFVSADLGAMAQGVQQAVMEKLRAKYGSLYRDENVLLSATHTHSGPGGYFTYALYDLTTFGFDRQNFNAISEGIFQSIVRAHDNLAPATAKLAEGDLLGASINRSPDAYLLNPAAERARYATDTDKLMTVMRIDRPTGEPVGVVDWFAVHGTSMGNDNKLISGDNKGYASFLFERSMGTNYRSAKTFVAAFAQSNEGDSSPNIFGGEDGGGANDFESTQLSAQKQYARAQELYAGASKALTGEVDFRQAYVSMDSVAVDPARTDGAAHTTCPAAIGISMLAGAEDGPGYGREGLTCAGVSDLLGGFVCDTVTTPCQGEKPIVLQMGTMKPYPWTPEVLPFQVLRIGSLAIVGVPFELTTMSGRRVRDTVSQELAGTGVDRVVIAGLSNAYAGYVATREEYAKQDYEGASTHFGPWALAAIQQNLAGLARAMKAGTAVAPGPLPRDLRNDQIDLQPGVVVDSPPLFKSFGDVDHDAASSYTRGQTAEVVFWSAHPKNDLRTQDTFLTVERKNADGTWQAVADDGDVATRYTWSRVDCLPTLACSHATIDWTIPSDAAPGTYRVRHFGNSKALDGTISAFTGTSRQFKVQ